MREASACNQRPSGRKIAVGEHLLKVTNQTHSVALGRTQTRSVTQTRSDALRCTQTHSDALTSSMRLSSVIRLNQTHSDALRRAHLLNAIEHPLNLHNLVSLHWRVSRVLTAEQQTVHVARYLMREVIRGHQRANQSQSEPISAARYRSHLIFLMRHQQPARVERSHRIVLPND
jgi:hypothetical protein